MAASEPQASAGMLPTDASLDADPFRSSPKGRPSPHRYSAFDTRLFSSQAAGSPSQTKRALEAHIADTDRRIQDASKLGTTLLEQRKQLSDRLGDVERQQKSNDIDPELKKKLSDLEKEFNEIGRESARASLSKNRKSSSFADSVDDTPKMFVSVADGGSPIKPSAHTPNTSRKQRNTSSRVEDLAFATEISTSLLGQVRHLQNVLAEKEDALRKSNSENARLAAEAENVGHKLRGLDESEQRYKDENWHLEAQVQELVSQAKDSATREQRLTQNLHAVKEERSSVERECDDLRLAHSKLTDDHAAVKKQHDTELSSMRRAVAAADTERETLQLKVDELTSQNEDLAKAVAYRVRNEEVLSDREQKPEEEALDLEQITPEHSPPPSPTKGTPRHGALESETLKSSLHHAHRMIQNLKNNIHREKTEKLELRRMLQEAREELDVKRADSAMNGGKRKKQTSQQDLFKKPARPDKLGEAKSSTEELLEDPDWEEYDDGSPVKPRTFHRGSTNLSTDASDAFETATERDNATDTDAFETAESVVGKDSDGDLTETEASNTVQPLRPNIANMGARARASYLSTASDDADLPEFTTPPRNEQARYRLKVNRGAFRRPFDSEDARESPASFVSNSSLPVADQDLAAELEDLGNSPSVTSSPPSRSIASPSESPQASRVTAIPATPITELMALKPIMVDAGTLTDPWQPDPVVAETTEPAIPAAVVANETPADLVDDDAESPDTTVVQDEDLTEVPPPEPILLEMSTISSQQTEPIKPVLPEPSAHRSLPAAILQPQAETPRAPSTVPKFSATPTPKLAGSSMEFVSDIIKQTPTSQPVVFTSKSVSPDENALPHSNEETSVIVNSRELGTKPQLEDPFVQEKRVPFQPVSGNAPPSPPKRKAPSPMKNEGTQTTVSAEQIESLIKEKERSSQVTTLPPVAVPSPLRPNTTERSMSLGSKSSDQLALLEIPANKSPKRPSSSGSLRKLGTSPPAPSANAPPLPSDHKEVIAAASRTSSLLGNMAPPTMPASSYRASNAQLRPQTPSRTVIQVETPSKAGPSSVATQQRPASVTAKHDAASTGRRSSVSSFASEVDERFNAGNPRYPYPADGNFDMGTDPRMIQAITQTMIGEFMWKYTRKAGRGEHSDNRHRRFFWIHPYTRTLYWTTQDPSRSSRNELKAKSVPIEAVRVVSDDNLMPPGLYPKSIVVVTPGRDIKITAPTSHRHETWFNALSYLLFRDKPERRNELRQQAQNYSANYSNTADHVDERTNTMTSLTAEDVSEFNPTLHSSSARNTAGASSARNSYRSYSLTTGSANRAARDRNSGTVGSAVSTRTVSPTGRKSVASTITRPSHRMSASASASVSHTPSRAAAASSSQRVSVDDHAPGAAVGEAVTTTDDQGFKKPVPPPQQQRPVSLSNRRASAASGTPGRLSSITSRLRPQSLFGREPPPESVTNAVTFTPTSSTKGRSKSLSSRSVRRSEPDMQAHARGMPQDPAAIAAASSSSDAGAGDRTSKGSRHTMENVRACCDGKHDVGSLSHRSSRHVSLSSRHSQTYG